MTFAQVETIFERCYNHLREVDNENAPNSYTWYAQTIKELEEEIEKDLEDELEEEFTGKSERVQEGVAYVFECNGNSLTTIRSDWSVEEVEDLFWRCFGFDQSFPREESSVIAE